MRDQTWLVLGVASVGAVLGLMVGASATPVVSVAVPTLFALAAAAIGLVQTSQINKEVAETIKALGSRTQSSPELETLRSQLASAPRRLGLILFAFSLAYLLSIIVGAKARTNEWLVTDATPPPLPWKSAGASPPDLESALEWIVIQHQLKSLGYDDQTVAAMYSIQAADWVRMRTSGDPVNAGARRSGSPMAGALTVPAPKAPQAASSNASAGSREIEATSEGSPRVKPEVVGGQVISPPSTEASSGRRRLPIEILPRLDKRSVPALARDPKLEEERRKILDRTG